ncbi:MAG: ectonucleotide pyrophosphatase/phosphodiesterase [Myxococcota bacterium]
MRTGLVGSRLVRALVGTGIAWLLTATGGAAKAEPRVVMISIDGLRPEVYLDPAGQGLRMPNLVELCAAGACARGMTPVFPSVTYPAHTSLVTGTRPAEHGIVSNFVRGQDWYLDAADIGSPTLWQAARAAGRKTAIVTWPASYGAEVDFLIPENLSFGVPDVRERIRDGSTPGLFDALEKKCGRVSIPAFEAPDAGDRLDAVSTCFAAEILRTKQPDLLLVHYLDADHRQHFAGVDSAEARHAFERIDGFVGELRRAVRDAGREAETIFLIVGDHGFVPVHTNVNVHALLAAAGLASTDGGRLVLAKGLRVSALGGSAAIYVEDGADPATAARLEAALRAEIDRRYHGLVELMPRAELEALGAFPGAAMGLAAAPGFMLIGLDVPMAVLPTGALKGMHGYRPTLPGMATGFIAAGPGIRRGLDVPVVRQIDVAPTVAALMGLRLDEAVGIPLVGLFETKEAGPGIGFGR